MKKSEISKRQRKRRRVIRILHTVFIVSLVTVVLSFTTILGVAGTVDLGRETAGTWILLGVSALLMFLGVGQIYIVLKCFSD